MEFKGCYGGTMDGTRYCDRSTKRSGVFERSENRTKVFNGG